MSCSARTTLVRQLIQKAKVEGLDAALTDWALLFYMTHSTMAGDLLCPEVIKLYATILVTGILCHSKQWLA